MTQHTEQLKELVLAGFKSYGTFEGPTLQQTAEHIEAEFILIPRDDLPEVKYYDQETGRITADNFIYMVEADMGYPDTRRTVLAGLAVMEWRDRQKSEQVEAKLQERRNKLGMEFQPQVPRYQDQNATVRKAVDRIIELEDQLKAGQ